MENKKAKKEIDAMLKSIESNGIQVPALVEQLQALRPYAVDEKIPLLAKVIRLTFEHLEENEGFFIPIPDDEPIEDKTEGEDGEDGEKAVAEMPVLTADFDPADSLSYLISLMKDVQNKINVIDLRAYCNALLAYEN